MRLLVVLLLPACVDRGPPGTAEPPLPSGASETVFSPPSADDPASPFFAALGTNGRSCATCHDRDAGWSLTPTSLQARFDATDGTDPVFRLVDGATSPTADTATADARRTAYAMLLSRGTIRVGRAIPAGAEFTLVTADDPYQFASAAELSLFRRPLPSTNLRFLAQIMWDGREASLAAQATDATLGHAQAMASACAPATIDAIVAFESASYAAQPSGAAALAAQPYAPGITGSFTVFAGDRTAIGRGEQIFDTHRFQIRNVTGLADQNGTCATCHDVPNVGARSVAGALRLGVENVRDLDGLDGSGLPVYTLANIATGETVVTSDPGLALSTGKWDDIGKFKVPVLRDLASRPPFFHDGSAHNLADVVAFYNRRFDMHLDGGEQADLVAFLSAL